MYISHDVPTPVSRDDFAARARIDVQFADDPVAMPLIKLDRQGLTVTVGEADRPALGLPRRARIVAGHETLCELRLVARRSAPLRGGAVALTLQPSRADDHALLWRALRAYQIHLGGVASGDEPVQWTSPAPAEPDYSAPRAVRLPLGANAAKKGKRSQSERSDGTGSHWANAAGLRSLVSCDAAFSLAGPEDAWFFSHWLDYHFAEIRAWAKMSDATVDLREIFIRVADHEVEVRFVFQSPERAVRAATETVCGRIEAEAARQLGMTVEHWLSGAATTLASTTAWSGRGAVVGSCAGGYSFSSKY
ncbi:hypothetical protein [Trinickia dabaoshanensis]|uniref:hypothetical protein n=1 Tax=Trinickia dabaoshanensis TaxID=564714 RepID=UPI0011AF21F6|nr:hypothetical protein [Trinickia dabaoshanensis]